jgi:Mg2+-importing ATPase
LFFGLGLLAGVVMFATHYSQEMAFAKLMLHARPAWLLVALVLQMGTYMTDARIWQRVLRRAHISRPLRSYVGLGLAKLFMDQAIPRSLSEYSSSQSPLILCKIKEKQGVNP